MVAGEGKRSRAELLRRLAVAAIALVAVDQALLHTLLRGDTFLGRPIAPFDPPLFSPGQRASLARIESHLRTGDPPAETFRFDPELGWAPRVDGGFGDYTYDWAGCRIGAGPLPREKSPERRRIVAVGCSMTHGEEVGPREAWCSLVDEADESVEVANLGVAAYGLDQALMRLRRDGFVLEPDEVWMGLLPEAGLRITTLYRPALRHWSNDVAFKPRFVVEDGRLLRLDDPVASLAEISACLADQERFLAAMGSGDHWVERARAAYAPRGSRLSHRSFLGRLALTLHEASGRDVEEAYRSAFLREPLDAIVRTAAAESRERGARFRLLILPGPGDLEHARSEGAGYWQGFVDDLAADGVEVVDLTPMLLEHDDPTSLYAPNGHFDVEGSRRVAAELAKLSGGG